MVPKTRNDERTISNIFQTTNELQQLTQSNEYKGGWSFYLLLAAVVTTLGSSLPVGYNIGVVNTPAEVNTTNELQQLTQSNEYKGGWSFYLLLAPVVTTLGSSLPVGYNIGVVNTPAEVNTTNELQQLTQSNEYKGGWSLYLLLAPVVTTLGSSLPVGYNIGVVIKSFCNESIISRYDVVLDERWLDVLWSSVVSIFIVGGCTGSILGAVLADRLGRSNNEHRADVHDRAGPSSIVRSHGQLLSHGESLREEVRAGRAAQDQGWGMVRVLRSRQLRLPLLLACSMQAGQQTSGINADQGWGMVRVLRSRQLRLPLLLACSMQAGQQTSGINAVFYYSQTIFKQAGLTAASSQYATIACGFINVCTALLMLRLLPRVGRRLLLLGSIASAALMLATLAAAMRFMDAVSWMPYVCMLAVFAYVLAYGFGLGPIPYFIASVGPRPAGMAWGSLANWGGNFLVGMSFPTMRETLGLYSFLVFSAEGHSISLCHLLKYSSKILSWSQQTNSSTV
ncbi:Solute carrier family 2, facilitated glucose transporter member 3 [Operophtera brumata]|uniref:Solute carrier family 2, facilitated glucose transporter member 3 n=1 Tax=Operophtera brumata TaxID=104452 RepID=A0A0L7L9X3_OPEBR|nr:Solute carrier family 2, facilitated glucose transporter member 3 [Operophtera brumata]